MSILLATREGLYLAGPDGGLEAVIPGADFLALAGARSAPGVYFAAATDGRVHRSSDGGRTWAGTGAVSGFAELSSLAVHPDDAGCLLAGMEPAALFRSRDCGRTWQADPAIAAMSRANGWSVPWSDAAGHVRTIAIDPGDPRRIYLAIEVGGVACSADGGETWENIRGGIHDDVHSVAVNPLNGAIVYAATRHGFGRSEDYGRAWTRIDGFEGQGYARPLAVNPERPDRVYTAVATTGPGGFHRPTGTECGVFRSDDGGLAWTRLTNGIPAHSRPYVDALDVDPARPDHVALANSDGQLFESFDGGDSWRNTAQAPPVRRLLIVP